jgi:hypothetical protein
MLIEGVRLCSSITTKALSSICSSEVLVAWTLVDAQFRLMYCRQTREPLRHCGRVVAKESVRAVDAERLVV